MDWDGTFFRIFGAVMSTDRNVRDAAELELSHVSQQEPNLLLYLLQYCTRDHAPLLGPSPDRTVVRDLFVSKLGAAIRFRNVITKSDWNRNAYFTEGCKAAVRSQIVQLLCQPHVEDKIRKQLAAATKSLVTYDYITGRWGDLPSYLHGVLAVVLPTAGSTPSSEGMRSLCGMLAVARHTCKVYENPTLVTPQATDEFATFMTPLLLQLSRHVHQVALINSSSPQAMGGFSEMDDLCATCLRFVLKCLSSLILPRWPLVLCDPQSAQSLFSHIGELWVLLSSVVLPKCEQVLSNNQMAGAYKQQANEWARDNVQWKLAKWVGKVSDRLIELLGVPSHCEKRARAAARSFIDSSFPANAASAAITAIQWHDHGGRFLSSKFLVLCLELVEHVVPFEAVYTHVVLSHVEALLTAILPRRLPFTAEDEELWSSNPEEYVRRLSDPRGDLYNPKLASMSLIVTLCIPSKPFHRNDLLFHYIQSLLQVLQAHVGPSGGDVSLESHRALDGCLYAITNMKRSLTHVDFGDDKIEWLLVTYVAPLLSSRCGFLRARAVFVLSQFSSVEWSNVEQHFHPILSRILSLLDDVESPVRIQTASCLSKFIRLEIARPVVTPIIASVVEKYFVMMRQADNDGVVRTLRKTIKFYGETLTTWAVQLCEMLVNQFLTLHSQIQQRRGEIESELDRGKGDDNDDNDEDGGLDGGDVADALQAGDELIATLRTLVECVPSHDDASTMSRLQELIVPMLVGLMQLRSEGAFGFMDSLLELLTSLIARSKLIAPVTWSVVETLHQLVVDGATDYFSQLLAPLDNMLSVDPRNFCCAAVTQAGHIPAKLVISMCAKVMEAPHLRCREIAAVPCIIDAISLNIKMLLPAISTGDHAALRDEILLPFLSMSLAALGSGRVTVRTLKVLFASNVLASVWAMPHDVVHYLASASALEFFFASYVQLVSEPSVFRALREYDLHLFILAVSEMMLVPAALSALSSLFDSQVLMQFVKASAANYEAEIKARKEDKHPGSEGDGWDSLDDDDETDSDGDFDLMDGEGDDGLEDDGLDNDDIQDDDEFREVLAAASSHRHADVDDHDEEDQDENLLDDDFSSPIDSLNPWQQFFDAASRLAPQASQVVMQQAALGAAMHAAASLWAERGALRDAERLKQQQQQQTH